MASINTNLGAMAAVSTLRTTDSRITATSKQLETGFKVADALDDASVFAVAQGIRSNFKANAAVQSSLQQGLGLIDVSIAALNTMLQLADNLRSTLIKASDGSLNGNQRDIYTSDATALHEQISDIINQASYNGRNQLLATSTTVQFVASVTGDTISVGTFGLDPEYTTLGTAIAAITDATTATAAYNLIEPLTTRASASISEFATSRRQISLQMAFNENVLDAMKIGLGALVDSDISSNDAVLASLAVQKQLAASALGIANDRQATLVSLYRSES
ncbi:flagellin [Ferrovibrio terrae]|uniref:flagellin n=1 Tax=Ferrovibrio terrae TaxID=2594003 RepID=UPI0031380F44